MGAYAVTTSAGRPRQAPNALMVSVSKRPPTHVPECQARPDRGDPRMRFAGVPLAELSEEESAAKALSEEESAAKASSVCQSTDAGSTALATSPPDMAQH